VKYDVQKIASIVDKRGVRLFNSIVGKRSFSKLISCISALEDSQLDIIFGSDKRFDRIEILRDEDFNKLGLHIFRIIVAEYSIHERRRLFGFEENDITDTMDSQGCLVIENFLDDDVFSKFEKIIMNEDTLNNLPGHYNRRTGWNSHYKIHKKNTSGPIDIDDLMFIRDSFYANKKLLSIVGNFCGLREFGYNHMHLESMRFAPEDPQSETHIDTFFSAIKFWLFVNDVNIENGPFCYSVGSCKNTEEKLGWEYEQSIIAHTSKNTGHREGSFRIDNKTLTRRLKFPEPKKLVVKKNSLVLQNNRGFHKRHDADPGNFRIGLYGDLRASPFLL